jgi:hypothetical protein
MKRAIGGVIMVLGVLFIVVGLGCAALEAGKTYTVKISSKTQVENVGAQEIEQTALDKFIVVIRDLVETLRESPLWLATTVVGILLVYIGYLMH